MIRTTIRPLKRVIPKQVNSSTTSLTVYYITPILKDHNINRTTNSILREMSSGRQEETQSLDFLTDENSSFNQKVNKANIKISHAVNDAKSLKEIVQIHESNIDWFNLINYSVLFNVLSKINQPERPETKNNKKHEWEKEKSKKYD